MAADPPWPYGDRLPGGGRGAAKHYSLMTLEEIQRLCTQLEFQRIVADDAHLYLWTTNSFLDSAFTVARAWGFVPKTVLTWVKARNLTLAGNAIQVGQDPRVQIGMGRSFRNCTEHVVVATKGRLLFQEHWRPGVFFASRTEHSVKPDLAYEIFEAMSPAPRLELFARAKRPGWATWGDEV